MNDLPIALSRRRFVALGAASGALVVSVPGLVIAQAPAAGKKDALRADLVNEFVRVAHGNLEKVKAMLAEEPALLNATWDWGAGDFEMAIGGAGHMGRRDIALFLIEKGARFDLFVAAMLGRLDLVKATLEAYPQLKTSLGPHRIPLTAHARAGGAEAAPVLEYLQSVGAT